MRSLPPLAAVRVFEAAARHLNFTAAARELGMTQSAVSYQIRLLEERLGLPLFHRQRGRVTLTPAARRAAALTTSAFDTIGDAFGDLRVADDTVLRISSANTFATKWLAPRIGAFQLRHPELAVRLDATDRIVDFASEEVDVAIRVTGRPVASFHAERLFPASFTPMVGPDFLAHHPLPDPAALLALPRLTPDDPWWAIWFVAANLPGVQPAPGGLRLDSQVAEASAAMAGAGAAILDPRMWRREIDEGRLIAPFELLAESGFSFWVVCTSARRNVPKIRAFRQWLVAAAAAG